MPRLVLVQDADGRWFWRTIFLSAHDGPTDMMIYSCDLHVGGPYPHLAAAVADYMHVLDRASRKERAP